MLEAGNIDLSNRPRVRNHDGSISTVRSLGVNIDNQEVLIPTVSEDGRIMGDEEAINTYVKTGRHLGKFKTPEESNAYAEVLHRSQEAMLDAPKVGGIAGLYAKEIGRSVATALSHPPPEPEPSWSTWALTKALGGGLVSGGLEYSGSVADLASGAAAPMAATGGSAGGMFASQTDAERRQEDEARQRMLKGPAFDPSMGNVMRAKAGEFAPDPITAHKSAQILHGLSAGVGKAVGSAMTFGPVAGAVVFGAEEGNTAAQNLMVAGVDGETAAKVGAVTAVASAVGAGLPVVGKTVAKTATLALTGGPGTYIAQEALSRKILADAGYSAQAEMHDPLDPVMLALSTVIPGAMGALAMRQAARAAARAKAAEQVRAEPAKEVQPTEPAPKAEAEPVKAAPPDMDAIAARAAEDPAAVDAARVRVLDDAEAKHIPPETPPGNERGIDVVRESVESGDMAPAVRMAAEQEARAPLQTETPAFREWFGESKVVDAEGKPLVFYHGTYSDFDAFDPQQTRDIGSHFGTQEQASKFGNRVVPVFLSVKKPLRLDDVFSTEGGLEKAWNDIHYETDITSQESDRLLSLAKEVSEKWESGREVDNTTIPEVSEFWKLAKHVIERSGYDGLVYKNDIEGAGDSYAVFRPEQIKSAVGNSGRFDPKSGSLTDPAPVATPRDIGQPETPGTEGAASRPGAEEPKPATPEQDSSRLSSAVDEIANADPNTMVQLPGHDAPMKLSDAMELIDQQTKELLQQGDFVKAAATCALMSGM